MKRIARLAGAHLAILLMLALVIRASGLDGSIPARGLAFESLLAFAAVFGLGGALAALALSRGRALRSTGARPIEAPHTPQDAWPMATVHRHAAVAGIPAPASAPPPTAGRAASARTRRSINASMPRNAFAEE